MSQSRTSFAGSNFGGSDKDYSQEKKAKKHPYDTVFGKRVNNKIREVDHAIAKISVKEFEDIQWPSLFPSIICDIIEYLTELSIPTMVKFRDSKLQEEKWKKQFIEEAAQQKSIDPNTRVTEKDLMDKWIKENKTPADFELEDLIV